MILRAWQTAHAADRRAARRLRAILRPPAAPAPTCAPRPIWLASAPVCAAPQPFQQRPPVTPASRAACAAVTTTGERWRLLAAGGIFVDDDDSERYPRPRSSGANGR